MTGKPSDAFADNARVLKMVEDANAAHALVPAIGLLANRGAIGSLVGLIGGTKDGLRFVAEKSGLSEEKISSMKGTADAWYLVQKLGGQRRAAHLIVEREEEASLQPATRSEAQCQPGQSASGAACAL